MKKLLPHLIAFALVAMPSVAFAACSNGGGSSEGGLINPTCFSTLDEFLTGVLNAVIAIAFPVVVLFLVYVGWLFIQAQGKEEKLNEAKKYFMYAVIGALIVLGAKALALAISATVHSLTP